MEKIIIRTAVKSDIDEIFEFLVTQFNDSPFELAHPDKSERKKDDVTLNAILESIEKELVLLATETSTETLAGIMIARPADTMFADNFKTAASRSEDQKRADFLKLLAYVADKANVFEKFSVDQSFYIHILSVHRGYRGKRIAQRLFESAIDLAKSKDFELVHVDCSSSFTSKIANGLGMELISTVTFDEYNDHLGSTLFVPHPPHMEIKTFAKKL